MPFDEDLRREADPCVRLDGRSVVSLHQVSEPSVLVEPDVGPVSGLVEHEEGLAPVTSGALVRTWVPLEEDRRPIPGDSRPSARKDTAVIAVDIDLQDV